jgi:putative transposase
MSSRWLSPWKNSTEKPVQYHCLSRVVDRRFVFEEVEREQYKIPEKMTYISVAIFSGEDRKAV